MTARERVSYLIGERMVTTVDSIDYWGRLVVTVPDNAWVAPKRDGWEHFYTARHGDHTRFVYRRG